MSFKIFKSQRRAEVPYNEKAELPSDSKPQEPPTELSAKTKHSNTEAHELWADHGTTEVASPAMPAAGVPENEKASARAL